MPKWALLIPIASLALVGAALALPGHGWLLMVAAAALIGSVLASVHHAEVVAHRVGEPFGTLILAVAVTVIEVALIVSMMLAGGPDKPALPRDTIFSAIMIICNGAVGLCVLLGGIKHHEQSFRLEGATSALAALIALSTLSLVLPAFTTSTPGATYNTAQIGFAAVVSLALWAVFVFVQTVRHRDYFLPPGGAVGDEAAHAPPPTDARAGPASRCCWSRWWR